MKNTAQKSMFWVMATLAIAIFPQLMSMPPQLIGLILLPFLWRWVAELKGWKPVPMAVRVAATGISVFMLVMTYGSLTGRRAAVSLLALMLVLKLLETYKVRDARVVASLSVFMCSTQFLFAQGIPMMFYAGAVLLGTLVSLALLQRREAWLPVGSAPETGPSVFSDLGYSGKLLAVSMPIALVMFLFFPRWGGPLWGVPETSLDAKSGLSDSMSPGSIQGLFMDDSPAFRADFTGMTPPPNQLYWRGPVFWDFDGREWKGTFYSRNLPPESLPTALPGSVHYQVQMEPTEQQWMFALDYPVSAPRGTKLTLDFQLYSFRPITQLKSYEMVSNPDFVDSPALKITHRVSALHLPEGFNPKTRAMMQEWRRETSSDVELVNRVLAYFNQENFFYTLNPPLLSDDTVDEFLFDTRSGFCEHYASAFTVMMRMAGIPARVVTGYQGGWRSTIGNYLLVRQSDAHAWSEVWLAGEGWTRVDPTAAVAPGRVERGAFDAIETRRYIFDFEWLRDAKNGFDLFQRTWNQWVIAFGLDQQSKLFKPFGKDYLDSRQLILIMVGIITVLGLLMIPVLFRLRLASNLDAAGKQWYRFRKKLEKAGVATSASMTPEELFTVAMGKINESQAELFRITSLYRQIRYAREGPALKDLEQAVHDFRPQRAA